MNFKNAKSLDSLLADKGMIHAVKCSKCGNHTAFDAGDIMFLAKIDYGREIVDGYITCPWCNKSMYVMRLDNGVVVRKYFTTIEGKEHDENKYIAKNEKSFSKGL